MLSTKENAPVVILVAEDELLVGRTFETIPRSRNSSMSLPRLAKVAAEDEPHALGFLLVGQSPAPSSG